MQYVAVPYLQVRELLQTRVEAREQQLQAALVHAMRLLYIAHTPQPSIYTQSQRIVSITPQSLDPTATIQSTQTRTLERQQRRVHGHNNRRLLPLLGRRMTSQQPVANPPSVVQLLAYVF